MTDSIIHWPTTVLPPGEVQANLTPFTRSGGRTLGGIDRVIRTDRGHWGLSLEQVPVYSAAQHRTWNALRTRLGGRAGLIAVPALSFKSAPFVSGQREPAVLSSHDDDTSFDDSTEYAQGAIDIRMASYAPLGATVVTLSLVYAASVVGIRFSYQHALYETGPILAQSGETTLQVPVFPAIRQPIPAGAHLEVDAPTCLCRLRDDAGMDISEGITPLLRPSVAFVEAVDYWNDLVLEVA